MQAVTHAGGLALRRRIIDLRRDIESRPHLTHILGLVIGELEREARALDIGPAGTFTPRRAPLAWRHGRKFGRRGPVGMDKFRGAAS